jgi:dTDP-4-amino-4,6-dideoxygalactose transaminase
MQVPAVDFKAQYAALRAEIDAAVARVLASGWFILGPEVEAFEREFAAYCGAAHAVGVANGTDAIRLALLAAEIGPGDEVITAPNTAVPTVSAIEQTGARAVFADIEEATFNLDPAALEAALTPRTRAIVPVHLYGQAAEMDRILEIAGRHGLAVVEDAAQAHGARYNGQMAGTIGAMGCFSFYPTKNLGAYGDGGAIVTDDAALAARLRRLRFYGQAGRYHNVERGVNSRLDELQAAILRVKLAHLDDWVVARRAHAACYTELLEGADLVLPREAPGRDHAWHLYVVRSPDRDGLRAHLAAQGIAADIHYPRLVYQQPAYTDIAPPGRCPVAERVAPEVLSLPMYPELTETQIRYVAEGVRSFAGG